MTISTSEFLNILSKYYVIYVCSWLNILSIVVQWWDVDQI